MAHKKIGDGIYYVGILNPAMRIFDVVMRTEYGTTYNSYIVKGKDKTALIEVSHATYTKHYLSNIQEVCDLADIDYVILNHCEPDHSGALAVLLDHCPKAQVIASKAGTIYLKNITNKPDMDIRAAKDGEELDLGGKTLKFIMAPFLHWPDSMFTWCESDKTLFSCDFFGAHYCEPYAMDSDIVYNDKYESALKGYYDAIFGPFKPFVVSGLEKIKYLDIEMACTSHGPVLTKGNKLEYVMDKYKEWSKPEKNAVKTIPVFYCSAYGNTGHLAQAIAAGIRETLGECDCEVYDINDHSMAELAYRLNHSDAFCIGSPTINADAVPPVMNLLNAVDAINNKKKPVAIFGSSGWSGEALPNMASRLSSLKMQVFGEGFKVIFVPTNEDLENAKEYGKNFAESLQ